MKMITCEGGVLRTQSAREPAPGSTFTLSLDAWNQLAPNGQFGRAAVHELLFDPRRNAPKFPALTIAKSAIADRPGTLIWCDPDRTLYPPAIALAGVSLDRVLVVRPKPADLNWVITECLRCKGVAAVIAPVPAKLSRVEARRFQLAAETGGGVGILLRSLGRGSDIYAAATRWLIEPARGERTVQRWKVELVHGHGGRVGQTVLLEKRRATDYEYLIDREAGITAKAATAVERRQSTSVA